MRTQDYPVAETPDLLLAALELANDAVVVIDDNLRVRIVLERCLHQLGHHAIDGFKSLVGLGTKGASSVFRLVGMTESNKVPVRH